MIPTELEVSFKAVSCYHSPVSKQGQPVRTQQLTFLSLTCNCWLPNSYCSTNHFISALRLYLLLWGAGWVWAVWKSEDKQQMQQASGTSGTHKPAAWGTNACQLSFLVNFPLCSITTCSIGVSFYRVMNQLPLVSRTGYLQATLAVLISWKLLHRWCASLPY